MGYITDNTWLRPSSDPPFALGGLPCSVNPLMRGLERAVKDVASSNLPVLVSGEPGTGKRALAFRIHQMSANAHEILRELDCKDLRSDELISAARADDSGSSDAVPVVGTLVLHEASSLSVTCQTDLYEFLLGALQEREGAARTPRLIFTTHANLEQQVRLGRFREDLYYRISGVCLRIPPLRHRKEDIPVLADHFLSTYAELLRRPKTLLSGGALSFFSDYAWPGNIRELEDTARTMAAIGDEKLALAALKSAQRPNRRADERIPIRSLKETSRAASRAAEKDLIVRVLTRTRWNRKRAAEELKISYKALLYKLKQMGVHDPNASPNGEAL